MQKSKTCFAHFKFVSKNIKYHTTTYTSVPMPNIARKKLLLQILQEVDKVT